MPSYEWKCKECGATQTIVCSIRQAEENKVLERVAFCQRGCETPMARVFGFNMKPMMPDHLNSSTGTYVSSERQLRDDMKRASEAATIRTGIEHNFVPVDHGDRKTLGVTDEGLDATYNRRKALGMPIPDVVKPGSSS